MSDGSMARLMPALGAARTVVVAAGLVWCAAATVQAQEEVLRLETRAERTGYQETSSYADVMRFAQRTAASSRRIHLTTFGYSFEGRALPLAVVGDVRDGSADAVHASGKLRVFVQANIHAGEVCGKEAMQMLLRDLARGRHAAWLDSLVLLIAPIYNADGNERVRLTNRGRQHGPVGGMGQRPNAQGLDLNRDHMKLESPEARSLVRLMREYDPHVAIDLHTTNGTHHGYHLTYSPPLHPNTHPGISRVLRSELFPAVTRAIKAKHGWDFYYYGNVPRSGVDRGWYTFDHRPRFNNNYVGLRNRLAILSEAYAYATFQDRVFASLWFVEEIIGHVHQYSSRIRRLIEELDDALIAGRELALTATWAESDEPVDIIMGEVTEERHPFTGQPMFRRTEAQRIERMPEFGTFRPVKTSRAPSAYVIPAELVDVLHKLDDHGIVWERVDRPTRRVVERFTIDSSAVAPREFQGHHVRTVFGSYQEVAEDIPMGAVIVSTSQPLGRLAFTLLEPESDDGLVTWNVLDDEIEGTDSYPIVRLPPP